MFAAGTPQVHPWRLARRVPRRDGPRRQLQASSAAPEGEALGMLNKTCNALSLQSQSEDGSAVDNNRWNDC